jgi:hypothetical protein
MLIRKKSKKMKKDIDYVITGVWFEHNKKGSEHIAHVMLHENLGSEIKCPGEKRSVEHVLHLLKTKSIYTCKWVYEDGEWIVGAKIKTVKVNGKIYISTVADFDVSNNLDNLINMACIMENAMVSV